MIDKALLTIQEAKLEDIRIEEHQPTTDKLREFIIDTKLLVADRRNLLIIGINRCIFTIDIIKVILHFTSSIPVKFIKTPHLIKSRE